MRLRPLLTLSLLLAPLGITCAQTITWKTYNDPQGRYSVSYPEGWEIMSQGKALVIRSEGGADRGVFGITLRSEGTPKETAVQLEFSDPEKASDLQQAPAKIAGLPAIKVWGSKKSDPSIRSVAYYFANGNEQYYVLFQAPHSSMARYSPLFNAMISSLKFPQ